MQDIFKNTLSKTIQKYSLLLENQVKTQCSVSDLCDNLTIKKWSSADH